MMGNLGIDAGLVLRAVYPLSALVFALYKQGGRQRTSSAQPSLYLTRHQSHFIKASHIQPMLLDPGLADQGDANCRFKGRAAGQEFMCYAPELLLSWLLRGLFCTGFCAG